MNEVMEVPSKPIKLTIQIDNILAGTPAIFKICDVESIPESLMRQRVK